MTLLHLMGCWVGILCTALKGIVPLGACIACARCVRLTGVQRLRTSLRMGLPVDDVTLSEGFFEGGWV